MKRHRWTALLLLAALMFVARDELFSIEQLVHETALPMPAKPASHLLLSDDVDENASQYTDIFELARPSRVRLRLHHDSTGWAAASATLVDVESDAAWSRQLDGGLGKASGEVMFPEVPEGRYRLHLEPRWEPRVEVVAGPPRLPSDTEEPARAYIEVHSVPERPWGFALMAVALLLPLALASPSSQE